MLSSSIARKPPWIEPEDLRDPGRLMRAIVLILKLLQTDHIIGQHCSITLRKAVVG
jgi:hypothetical protein